MLKLLAARAAGGCWNLGGETPYPKGPPAAAGDPTRCSSCCCNDGEAVPLLTPSLLPALPLESVLGLCRFDGDPGSSSCFKWGRLRGEGLKSDEVSGLAGSGMAPGPPTPRGGIKW